MITEVPGVLAGHWTGDGTGVTVIVCPDGTVGSAEVRGGAPATREVALLEPTRTVERVDAVVFAGGSAFGLAATDGVVSWLAEQGRGVPTTGGPVPIVPAACIFDLAPVDLVPVDLVPVDRVPSAAAEAPAPGPWIRPGPGPEEARIAVEAADRGDTLERGRVGAGTGATVGKWRGVEHAVAGGVGGAAEGVALAAGRAMVGVLAVVNAVGDVVDESGQVLAGSRAPAHAEIFPEHRVLLEEEPSTTLVAVATDAGLTKLECQLLAQSAHHGLALALRPSHTRFDGDLVVALATGTGPPPGATGIDRLRHVTTAVVADAVRDAVRQT